MKGRHESTYAKAKAEVRAQAEGAFVERRKDHGKRALFALLGEIQVPQKVDKDGYGVPGVWVLPGCREATTAELYAISKKQGMSLLFTNSKGA